MEGMTKSEIRNQKSEGRMKVRTIIMGPAGQFAVFDEAGEQLAVLQRRSAVALLAEAAERLGFEVEGCRVETPRGEGTLVRSEAFGWTVR